MSNDLVARLRQIQSDECCDRAADVQEGGDFGKPTNLEQTVADAADEIGKLQLRVKELESWRAAVFERAERAEAERDAYCNTITGELNTKIYALEQKRDALRHDAERYRWLRAKGISDYFECSTKEFRMGTVLDAAIDAARGK